MNATDNATGGWVTTGDRSDSHRVTALYDAHVGEVYRYVYRLCLDHSIAEDVTQDVFLAALGRPPSEISVGVDLSYTLGFYQPHLPFTDLYGHGGNNDGFTSFFMLDAEDDWGFVLFTNSEHGQVLGEELFLYLLTGPSVANLAATVGAMGFLALAGLVVSYRRIRRWTLGRQ